MDRRSTYAYFTAGIPKLDAASMAMDLGKVRGTVGIGQIIHT